jgi:GNAT-like C-terminal domain/N-acyltransferase N-terminal domain
MADIASVEARYRIDPMFRVSLEELAAVAPADVVVPDAATARTRLDSLGVGPAVADDVVGFLPAIARDPDAWWLVTRCTAQLAERVDAAVFVRPRWPSLEGADDPLAPYLYVAAFLFAVPGIEHWYHERGVDEAIMWCTLNDLGVRMRIRARTRGRPGLDTEQRWLTQHFTAQLFQLGRLQFNRDGWYYAPELAPLVPLTPSTSPRAVGVHIPEGGPLDPGACEASFAAAGTFFGRYFGREGFRVAVCTSWLLDEQLAEYLPAESNIVRFQRCFHLLPGSTPGNEDVSRFVFDERDPLGDGVAARTSLQRAVVQHLRAGGEWRIRTGWVEL